MSNITTSICRSCRLSRSTSIPFRTLSTSSRKSAIPPESPNYVDIPDTYQTDFFPPRRQKGILPVPREIFPPRQPDKPSQEYLSRAIPPQTAPSKPTTKMSESEKYKARMTTLRRQHLRSGLLELYNRKVVMSQQSRQRAQIRQEERNRLISQPPREDERLTTPTIPTSMCIIDPVQSHDATSRAALHALKTANTAQHTAKRTAARLDALHTLYMNARTFITNETQLAAELDRVFDRPAEEWGTATADGTNIWNREPPFTIAALMRELETGKDTMGLKVQRVNSQRYRTDQARMKKLAEVLSGGKM